MNKETSEDHQPGRPGAAAALVAAAMLLTTGVPELGADGLRNPPPGAFGLARGAAKLAHVDDATAVFINPANLLDLEYATVSLAPSFIDIERNVEADWGGQASTIENLKALGGFYAAFPTSSERFAWGIGLSVPYGQSVVYEEDFAFKYLAPHFTELKLISLNPTVAYRLSDSFSIGVGLDLMWSQLKLRQSYSWARFTGDAGNAPGNMNFEADGTAVGGILAINWDLNPDNRVSFTYRPPFHISYDGRFEISEVPQEAPAFGVSARSPFRTRLDYPAIWALGYGLQLNERWRIGIGAEFLEWSSFQALELDVDNNSVLFSETTLPQLWEDAWTWGVSADYRASDLWTLRGGYWAVETPIPTTTQRPNLPESDFQLFSIGAKRSLGRHSLELAYAYTAYDSREVTDNLIPEFNGSYTIDTNAFYLIYSFVLR